MTKGNTCQEQYMLVASSWSNCETVDRRGDPALCGGGLQTRNITCLQRSQQQPVEDQFCENLHQIPRVQRCSVKCEEQCQLSQWTEWTPCKPADCRKKPNQLLQGSQTRTRGITSSPDSISSCPHLEETRSCTLTSCYTWQRTRAGRCRHKNGQTCGEGLRKLFYHCVDFNGLPVEESYCRDEPSPLSDESCTAPCPEDCVLSAWGEWARCPADCSKQDRLPLVQRNRTIIAINGQGGFACPPEDELTEVRMCPQAECEVHRWAVGPWGPCKPSNITRGCGGGGTSREVYCVDGDRSRVADWKCRGLQSPISWQSCIKPCPKTCLLTAWSEWSPCRRRCDKDGSSSSVSGVIMDTQSRTRSVLQWPSEDAEPCPERLEIRPCPLLAASCRAHHWQPDHWSECHMPEGKTCGDGIRTRSLRCVRSGMDANRTECMGSAMPPQEERCSVDCRASCVLTEWTPWTDCEQGCPGSRRRQRKVFGSSALCRNHSLFPETEVSSCGGCQNFSSRASGSWSECLLDVKESNKVCGIGKRYRRLECYDDKGRLVNSKYCGGQEYVEESCIVACPMDCHMSAWSDWGMCDANCGPGLKNRTSKVLRLPSVGGRPCPGPAVEYDMCNYPCEHFTWVMGTWSECLLPSRELKCGSGIRTRSVRCVEVQEDGPSLDVPTRFCDPVDRPPETEDCALFCPGQCAVSKWTEWSQCEKAACRDPSSKQRRSRSILRPPADGGGDNCPHLTEERSCMSSKRHCDDTEYSWALTPWSSCQPIGDSGCGEGRQLRGARCIRERDGRSVPDSRCDPSRKPHELVTWCNVDCPVDCEVSEWSQWNKNECQCGSGRRNMTRTRIITTPGSETGRPCPDTLIEYMPCAASPCFEWHRTPWKCEMQGASCGFGVARRNVSCILKQEASFSDSLIQVEWHNCREGLRSSDLPLLDLSSESICYKSCPGDCVLSEWTQWSACHAQCIGVQTIGFRNRTRSLLRSAIPPHGNCLAETFEREMCLAKPCFEFAWAKVNGRKVCRRSDGLVLPSGCSSRSSYSNSDPDCSSRCPLTHSQCSEDECICQPGFLPKYLPPLSSNGKKTLIACLAMSQNTVADQAAKGEGVIESHYFPDDSQLNYWMFAMIGIGCVFIAFVGVSIYIMCKSTSRHEAVRIPK